MDLNARPQVFPIPTLNVRVFLIQSRQGWVLIDAGMPFHEKLIQRSLRSLGVALADIKTIILTHGHLDHIGCLSYLESHSGAAVICHQSLQKALESGGFEKAVPRVPGWKILNPLVSALLRFKIHPVDPDHIFEKSLDLKDFGLNGLILHTPGHSPGSCSILLEGGICFLGDLLRERSPGIFDTGLFYHDRDRILASLKEIASLEPETIYLSHGTTMTGKDLEAFIDQTNQRPHGS